MNNREQLSKKSNPETKEKNQKSKGEYQSLATELVLAVLRQGLEYLSLWAVLPKGAVHWRYPLEWE